MKNFKKMILLKTVYLIAITYLLLIIDNSNILWYQYIILVLPIGLFSWGISFLFAIWTLEGEKRK